jgi:hypothetical protein
MAITPCTVETNVISQLADKPALTSAELKQAFDLAGAGIKNYINNTLIPGVNAEITSSVNTLGTTVTNNQTANNTRFATDEADISGLKTRMTTAEGNITTLTTSVNGKQKAITVGTSTPSGGSNGDIYIQYFT